MKAKSQFQSIECRHFHRIKTRLDSVWPGFAWRKKISRWRLCREGPGPGGREASFVCLAEYAILGLASDEPHPARIFGQLTPLWLPQTPGVLVPAPASLPLLCCLYTIMVRDEQTIVCSTRQVISLTLHSPFSFAVCCAVIYLSGSLVALSDTAGRQAHVRCPVSAPANTIIANFPINDFYTILTTLK